LDNTLEERIATMQSLLGHDGWQKEIVPQVLRWQAVDMNELLSDVGDKKGRNDFLRGRVNVLKQFLKHFMDLLPRLQEELEETRTGMKAEIEDSAIPPAI
jgi:hypothetical protein